jgi:hypothetical protein
MESYEDYIPTISDEETASQMRPKSFSSLLSHYKINDCILRIFDAEDLLSEFTKIEINIRQVASIIARARYDDECWELANRKWEKVETYEKDFSNKVRKRVQKPLTRKKIESYTTASARKIFAREETLRIKKSDTKERPYLPTLLVVLEAVFRQKIDNPYRYIAALFNLFNLRPEKACNSCKLYNMRTKSCIEKLDGKIFDCPNHKNTRNSIWEMTQKAKKEFPDLLARLEDPKNQS